MRHVGSGCTHLSCAREGARRGASTLIELLTVVSIIAFLMGLLLPSLKRSMELAHATSCKVNLRQLGQGLQMYRFENDGWLPLSTPQVQPQSQEPGGDVSSEGAEPSGPEPWFARLFPTYLMDPMVLSCPKDPYGDRVKVVASRVHDAIAGDVASYGVNSFMMSAGGGYLANVDRYPPKRPLDTILLADLGPDQVGGMYPEIETTVNLRGPSRNSSLLMWSDRFDPFYPQLRNSWVTRRHGHGIHMVTLAGEVRDVKTDSILRQPIRKYYPNCAAGGCTFCNELRMYHYSFARARLFWWTGQIPPR